VKVAGIDQGGGDTADGKISLNLENISSIFISGNCNQKLSTARSSSLSTYRTYLHSRWSNTRLNPISYKKRTT
jgi:hypothetical protein